jgi:integrase
MPRLASPLTTKICAAAMVPAGGKIRKLSDSTRGLTLEILPNGKKTWTFVFLFAGKQQRSTLGTFPAMPIADARIAADLARAEVSNGKHPNQVKSHNAKEKIALEARGILTFREVFDSWYARWKVGITARHAMYNERRVHADVLPEIGHLPMTTLTSRDVLLVVKRLQAREVHDLAKRMLNVVQQVCDYAVIEGVISTNPCAAIKPAKYIKRPAVKHLARIDAIELPTFVRKIESYDSECAGRSLTGLALSLMLLTFVRTTELIEGRWCEIDWHQKLWRIPASRMKMKREHLVPLSSQALKLLRQLKDMTGEGAFMFPGMNRQGSTMSKNTLLFALYRLGYHGRMTGHGFRGLASTTLNENGWNPEWVEMQLAHAKGAIEGAYNNASYLTYRRQMMQWWSDFIDIQRTGSPVPVIDSKHSEFPFAAQSVRNISGQAMRKQTSTFSPTFEIGHVVVKQFSDASNALKMNSDPMGGSK